MALDTTNFMNNLVLFLVLLQNISILYLIIFIFERDETIYIYI